MVYLLRLVDSHTKLSKLVVRQIYGPSHGSVMGMGPTEPRKHSLIFHYFGSLIGILIIVYYNPHITSVPCRELTYPPKNGILKMIFLFPRWDMLVPWRVGFHPVYILNNQFF